MYEILRRTDTAEMFDARQKGVFRIRGVKDSSVILLVTPLVVQGDPAWCSKSDRGQVGGHGPDRRRFPHAGNPDRDGHLGSAHPRFHLPSAHLLHFHAEKPVHFHSRNGRRICDGIWHGFQVGIPNVVLVMVVVVMVIGDW